MQNNLANTSAPPLSESPWDNRMAWMAYASLLVLALGLFTSTSLCSLSLALMYPPGIYFTWLKYKNTALWHTVFPVPAWALISLVFTGIISCAINAETISPLVKTVFKVKYFLLGALAIAPFQWLKESSFFSIAKLRMLLSLIIISLISSTLYGAYAAVSHNDFLSIHETSFPWRNYGFTDYMRHAHSSLYISVLFSWALVHGGQRLVPLRTLLVFGIIVALLGIITTGTRGALGALLVSMPIIWGHKKWVKKIAVCGITCVVIILAVNLNYSTKGGLFRAIEPDRANMWYLAFHAFKEKPVLGHGLRQFEKQAPRLEQTHGHWITQPTVKIRGMAHAHNNLMQFLADLGIIGLFFYLIWIVTLALITWPKPTIRWGMLALIVAFSSAGMLQYVFDTQGALTIFILTAMALAINEPSREVQKLNSAD